MRVIVFFDFYALLITVALVLLSVIATVSVKSISLRLNTIGTVTQSLSLVCGAGIIAMFLSTAKSMSEIGPMLATAILTTLYGSFIRAAITAYVSARYQQ